MERDDYGGQDAMEEDGDSDNDRSPPVVDTIVVATHTTTTATTAGASADDDIVPANDDRDQDEAATEQPASTPTPTPAPAPTPTPTPTSGLRRSSRRPARASQQQVASSSSLSPSPSSPPLAKKRGRIRTRAKNKPRKWDAERLVTDPKSPLARANLRTILSNPAAWNCLTPEDHSEILALFPDHRHILTDETAAPRPNMQSLMNDDNFRYDCAAYTENLLQGRHDQDWLAQAWAASERRKMGDFDEFLRRKLQEDWEVQLPHDAVVAADHATDDVTLNEASA